MLEFPCFLKAEYHIVCIYHVLCYHLSIKGYPFLAVVNNATVKHGCTNIWSPNSLVIHTELELLVHMVIYFSLLELDIFP